MRPACPHLQHFGHLAVDGARVWPCCGAGGRLAMLSCRDTELCRGGYLACDVDGPPVAHLIAWQVRILTRHTGR